VQKAILIPAAQRLKAVTDAGYNTFLLKAATSSWTCSPTAAPTP